MSRPTAKFASAVFAGVVAGVPLATISHSAPEAADSCLSGPKGPPPEGGHWYYHIDRATKRHCWYIGDEKQKVSGRARGASQPAAHSVSPPNDAAAQDLIANARAELPSPQTRVEPETSVFAAQRAPAKAVDAISQQSDQPTKTGDAGAPRSIVASRWPELTGTSSAARPGPSAATSQVVAPANPEALPPPAAASVRLTAADASLAKPSGSIQQLLIAIVGAVSLAGLIASGIYRFGGGRRTTRRDIRVDRRVNWDSARATRPSLSDEARGATSMREIGFCRKRAFAPTLARRTIRTREFRKCWRGWLEARQPDRPATSRAGAAIR